MVRSLNKTGTQATAPNSTRLVQDVERESVIRELVESPALPRLLQDAYGNYVIQSALAVSSGALHVAVVEAIKPFLPALRGTPHGKRILQRIGAK